MTSSIRARVVAVDGGTKKLRKDSCDAMINLLNSNGHSTVSFDFCETSVPLSDDDSRAKMLTVAANMWRSKSDIINAGRKFKFVVLSSYALTALIDRAVYILARNDEYCEWDRLTSPFAGLPRPDLCVWLDDSPDCTNAIKVVTGWGRNSSGVESFSSEVTLNMDMRREFAVMPKPGKERVKRMFVEAAAPTALGNRWNELVGNKFNLDDRLFERSLDYAVALQKTVPGDGYDTGWGN